MHTIDTACRAACVAAMAACAALAPAAGWRSLRLTAADGKTTAVGITDGLRVTFDRDNIYLRDAGEPLFEMPLADLSDFSVSAESAGGDISTSVAETVAGITLHADRIDFDFGPVPVAVTVFTDSGMTVCSMTAASGSVDISRLERGHYVALLGKHTIKFVKR